MSMKRRRSGRTMISEIGIEEGLTLVLGRVDSPRPDPYFVGFYRNDGKFSDQGQPQYFEDYRTAADNFDAKVRSLRAPRDSLTR